jgi:hypothetical protein
MDDNIKAFLTYDYTEAKDLAKSFLTLVSAILVGTITFSEKIVNFQTASRVRKGLVVGSWSAFVGAIVFAGLALVYYYNALLAGRICGASRSAPANSPYTYVNCALYPYDSIMVIGNWVMFAAGALFVLGLLALVISAIIAVKPLTEALEST